MFVIQLALETVHRALKTDNQHRHAQRDKYRCGRNDGNESETIPPRRRPHGLETQSHQQQ